MTTPPLDHATRRTGIGGSDIPVLLGLSKYRSPMDLYLSKTGEAPASDPTPAQEWGQRLEPVILQKLAHRHHLTYGPHPGTVVGRQVWAHALYTPDAVGERFLAEVKSRNAFTSDAWGVDGSTDLPEDVYAQVQWGMGVLGRDTAYVGVLIGGSDFRSYVIPRRPDYFRNCLSVAQAFWAQHIVAQVPPPFDGSAAGSRWLQVQYPRVDSPDVVEASASVADRIRELFAAKATLAEAETTVDRLAQIVKQEIGDRAGLSCPAGRVTWTMVAGRKTVDWKAVAAAAAVPPPLIERYTTVTGGGRVFRATAAKGG